MSNSRLLFTGHKSVDFRLAASGECSKTRDCCIRVCDLEVFLIFRWENVIL